MDVVITGTADVTVNVASSNNTGFLSDDDLGAFGTFILASSLLCIMIMSLFGNGLIFLISYKKPAMLTIANRYILHLAICQFAMTVLVMPSTLVSVFANEWVFSVGWCGFTGFCKLLLLTSIILTLLLISVERYISISRPMTYHRSFIVNFWFIFLIAVWVFAIAVAIPPMLGWSNITYSRYQFVCSVTKRGNGLGYILFLFFLGFLTPILIMGFVYLNIFWEARKLIVRLHPRQLGDEEGRSLNHEQPRSKSREKKEKWVLDEWRVAKTGIMVISAYAVCWFPAFMVMLLYLDGQDRPWWVTLSAWMAFGSCAINPYVYVFRSRTMRKQASLLLARVIRRDIFEVNTETMTRPWASERGASSTREKQTEVYKEIPLITSGHPREDYDTTANRQAASTPLTNSAVIVSNPRRMQLDVTV